MGFVTGLDDPGFRGSGGGARSGSELSHLESRECRQHTNAQILFKSPTGTEARHTWGPMTGQDQKRKVDVSGPPRGRESSLYLLTASSRIAVCRANVDCYFQTWNAVRNEGVLYATIID